MKFVITAKGNSWESPVDERFGRAQYFFIFDEAQDTVEVVNNSDINSVEHGAGPKTAGAIAGLAADVLITGNGPGKNAASVLQKTGIKIYTGAGSMSVREAYTAFKSGLLGQL